MALVGLENIEIGDTVSDRNSPRALPRLVVDEPTLKMTFGVNTSPLAGQEGRYLTSRHLRERLMKELQKNVALRVEPIPGTEQFSVSGRGILHLSVLIETMRREGFELSIGKPHVILRDNHGVTEEPFESLVVEVPEKQTGPVMEMTGQRRGQLVDMQSHNDYCYMVFSIPARGLIGLRTRLLNATQGTAVIHHRFECYKPLEGEIETRATGVLVSLVGGRAVAYALDTLQDRSELHVGHNDVVYEGMIVGENSRSDDMNVNPTKEKKLIQHAGRRATTATSFCGPHGVCRWRRPWSSSRTTSWWKSRPRRSACGRSCSMSTPAAARAEGGRGRGVMRWAICLSDRPHHLRRFFAPNCFPISFRNASNERSVPFSTSARKSATFG